MLHRNRYEEKKKPSILKPSKDSQDEETENLNNDNCFSFCQNYCNSKNIAAFSLIVFFPWTALMFTVIVTGMLYSFVMIW